MPYYNTGKKLTQKTPISEGFATYNLTITSNNSFNFQKPKKNGQQEINKYVPPTTDTFEFFYYTNVDRCGNKTQKIVWTKCMDWV
jgi:hypothetical protein